MLSGTGSERWVNMERIKKFSFPIMRSIEFIAVLAAITAFFMDFFFDRPQDRIIRAWNVIAQSNIGQGNIGQIAALKTLKNAGEDIRGINLNMAWLQNVDLSNLDLSRVDFSYANLHGTTFKSSNLTQANFIGADISGAKLEKANLADAIFDKDVLERMVNITGANFLNAKNIPDLSGTCADPDNPPTNIPVGVAVPDQWVGC